MGHHLYNPTQRPERGETNIQSLPTLLSVESVETMLATLDPPLRYELHKGSLIDVGASSRLHTLIGALFVGLLGNHVEEKELGGEVTGANGTFKLTAYDTSVPNCAYISEEKTNALPPETVFYPFAPDLAVEIRSALQSKRYMDELAVMYLNAGSKLVWMVDPQALTIEVYRANGTRTLLRHDAYLSGETLLPGFRVSLKKVFSVVEKLNPMTPP